ncbi:MAG: hypothetical protein ACYS8Z_27070 [Planctomycetota bacterium]|jgi:hypothetical protein
MKEKDAFWWILAALVAVVVIIYSLWEPGRVRKFSLGVKQNAQFHSIEAALELFNNEFDGYPPSGATDPNGAAYCGAMKLCEAVMGQDMLGFHSEAIFRADGKGANGRKLYDPTGDLTARKGPYLPPESADTVEIQEIWPGAANDASFLPTSRLLCDVYTRSLDSGKKVGMPILYYKADTSKNSHDVENPDNPDNIYNYKDNHALLALGVPDKQHPLYADPNLFYKITRNSRVKDMSMPRNANSYILISAGYDRLYGTEDDVMNFKNYEKNVE